MLQASRYLMLPTLIHQVVYVKNKHLPHFHWLYFKASASYFSDYRYIASKQLAPATYPLTQGCLNENKMLSFLCHLIMERRRFLIFADFMLQASSYLMLPTL